MGKDQSAAEIKGEQFPAIARLKRQTEFDAVFIGNRFAADETLVVTGVRTELPAARLGLSIGRHVGNAVVRNQWKRLIREAFRRNRRRLPAALDIVVRPRKGAVAEFARVERSLLALTRRLDRDLNRIPPATRPSAQAPNRPRRSKKP